MEGVRFDGQQDGERVLYEVSPHPMVKWVGLAQVGIAGVALIVLFWLLSSAVPEYTGTIRLVGFLLGIMVSGIGWLVVTFAGQKSKAFITDRRIVRLMLSGLWRTNHRTLSWDEVVKVKTISPNFWLRMMNIGDVVVHARTPEDDVSIPGVSYYLDLGNYLDKIVYLYKKEPDQLKTVRVFVPKPRGQRY